MRTRVTKENAEKRMLNAEEASTYIGMGISRTRQLMSEVGAKRVLGRRVVYDKVIIDKWLDSMADQEGATA